MSPAGTSFHKFLGLRPLSLTASSRGHEWDLSVDDCLSQMRKKKTRCRLQLVRVVILEEGLELQSNILEAYFRYKKEVHWDVITIINGDPCQGNYHEDINKVGEVSFFAKNVLVSEICPNCEVCTFTEDLRTKNILLRRAKTAVRNATVTTSIFSYLQSLKYKRQETPVDIILCAQIRDMNAHNHTLLAENKQPARTYWASTPQRLMLQPPCLNYKEHGVENRLELKIGAPIMITHDVEVVTIRGTKVILKNGTAGAIADLHENYIKVMLPILKGMIVEVKPILVPDTPWKQIPVVLSYAATIAKCIGFEFDNVAVDFGLQGRTQLEIGLQSNSNWRQKMAYTAITRAKQQVYFIGTLHVNIFNNMDTMALNFFNSKVALKNAKLEGATSVLRDVQELKEFWIQSSKLASNEKRKIVDARVPSTKKAKKDIFSQTRKVTSCVDGNRVEILAYKYPNVLQHIHGQGYLVTGTSNEYRNVILKVPCRRLETQSIDAEYGLLRSLRDVHGILHILGTLDRHPATLVLEGMIDRVPWNNFILHATADAKQRFKDELQLVIEKIHTKQIVHGNISEQSVLINMKGEVKLTWFQSDIQFCNDAIQQDLKNMRKLFSELTNGVVFTSANDHNNDPPHEHTPYNDNNDNDGDVDDDDGGDDDDDDEDEDEDEDEDDDDEEEEEQETEEEPDDVKYGNDDDND